MNVFHTLLTFTPPPSALIISRLTLLTIGFITSLPLHASLTHSPSLDSHLGHGLHWTRHSGLVSNSTHLTYIHIYSYICSVRDTRRNTLTCRYSLSFLPRHALSLFHVCTKTLQSPTKPSILPPLYTKVPLYSGSKRNVQEWPCVRHTSISSHTTCTLQPDSSVVNYLKAFCIIRTGENFKPLCRNFFITIVVKHVHFIWLSL